MLSFLGEIERSKDAHASEMPIRQELDNENEEDEGMAARAFEQTAPLVVGIGIDSNRSKAFETLASGLIWALKDKTAYVVSSYTLLNSVLRDQGQLKVSFPAASLLEAKRIGRSAFIPGEDVILPASLVARDPSNDLLVISVALSEENSVSDGVDAQGSIVPKLTVADTETLVVGQDVFMIGVLPWNMKGNLTRTISQGVLSALKRALKAPNGQIIPDCLQFDAAITSPMSGGSGLFDTKGNLVGIFTGGMTSSSMPAAGTKNAANASSYQSGVHFGVSGKTLLKVVPNLIAYGNASGRR